VDGEWVREEEEDDEGMGRKKTQLKYFVNNAPDQRGISSKKE